MPASDPAAEVLRAAGSVRARTTIVRVGERALTGLLLGCALALPLLAAGWVFGDFPRLAAAAMVIPAATAAGAIAGFVGAPSMIASAARLDRRAGLQSEFTAAVELAAAGETGPFAEPLFRRAMSRYVAAGAAGTRLGDHGPLPGRLAILAAAAVVLFAVVPAGVLGGGRREFSDFRGLAESFEPHARNLQSGGGDGAPTPEAIRNAIEQLKAAGKALRAPDIDPAGAEVALMRVDEALRAAIEALPREPLSDDQKERWDEFLRRAESEIARRLRDGGRPGAPEPVAKAPNKAGGKSSASADGGAGGADVASGAGGKTDRTTAEPAGRLKRPAGGGNFDQVWDDLRRSARPAAAEADPDPRYRDLIRTFFR
jgi:hypothetical protein